jgi:cytochrome P450
VHFVCHLTKDHFTNAGKLSFTWFGPIPRVTIHDPELVREVLSNKFGHYGKQRSSRFGKLLANGVVNHEGEKWAKHRRILNPAFHHEKIKVTIRCNFIVAFTMFSFKSSCLMNGNALSAK